jgi:predicted PhzF superfamily epimerase YddE/YHI9
MKNSYPVYKVDAFTSKLFGGNPAAVCPLNEWLADWEMQLLATENNLSETAFFVKQNDGSFYIRWFTPEYEIDLCGHATLATAYVIFYELGHEADTLLFNCKSGLLTVQRKANKIELDFPARMPQAVAPPEMLLRGLSIAPQMVLKSRDYFAVYRNEEEVRDLQVSMDYLNQLDTIGVIVTALGNKVDFVSRFFVPNSSIYEDPVTGSAHCSLIPYWANQLDKNVLTAQQLSKRVGHLWCAFKGGRVTMAGQCVLYMKGEYYLP